MHEFVLILALLTTESSYKSEVERPAIAVADTAQFWFGSQSPWRIRTYAIDHDIHIYSVGSRTDSTEFTQEEAMAHLAKHYNEIVKRQYVLKFQNPADPVEVKQVLEQNGLLGTLEVAPAGFAFYNPDRQKYKTQSTPKQE